MKRILVTGAAGFVGRRAVAALAAEAEPSDQILGIGRDNSAEVLGGVAFRQVNLLDHSAVMAVITDFRPTDVLHLAAVASVQQSADSPVETWCVNLGGLLNLAEAMTQSTAGATLYFVSSGEVYGRAFLTGRPVDESVEPLPLGSYARSKWFGEEILRDVLPKAGVRLVILRPFNHIGPGQDERFVISSFAGQIARIEAGKVEPVLRVGNLDACRDFLSVGDVVRAYVTLITRSTAIESGSVFNIASGQPRSIRSVLADLRNHARTPFEVQIAADRVRPSDIPVAAGDAARLKAEIGWAPAEDWKATLAAVLDDARSKCH